MNNDDQFKKKKSFKDKIREFFDISLEWALFWLLFGMFILSTAAKNEPPTYYGEDFNEICVNAYDC